jgi:hypothetical protein
MSNIYVNRDAMSHILNYLKYQEEYFNVEISNMDNQSTSYIFTFYKADKLLFEFECELHDDSSDSLSSSEIEFPEDEKSIEFNKDNVIFRGDGFKFYVSSGYKKSITKIFSIKLKKNEEVKYKNN